MQTFKTFFDVKQNCPVFHALYQRECHVCANTVRVFAAMDARGLSLVDMAEALQVDPHELQVLRDADACDPQLVVRLCRHLDLTPPADCPRQAASTS